MHVCEKLYAEDDTDIFGVMLFSDWFLDVSTVSVTMAHCAYCPVWGVLEWWASLERWT